MSEEDIVEVEEPVQEQEELNEVPNEEEESKAEEKELPDEVVERAKKYGHLSKEEWIAQGRDCSL